MSATAEYSERRLERAVQHVSAHWFPINPVVLATVRKGLNDGAYDLDIGFLINELKSDFALFTYCVKELLAVAAKERVPITITSDPVKLIRWAGVQRVKPIFATDRPTPSTHNLAHNEEFHHDRLLETSVAASATELLTKKTNLDPETGYCHSVVRQIGLNLIAWNYPSLYSRVLRSLTNRTTLEDELSKELGFSPSVLALRLLRPSMPKGAMGNEAVAESWRAYDALCEVGEALARASNPENYPSAEHDWKKADAFITETLGPDGIHLIRKRAVENTHAYRKTLPATFAELSQLDPQEKIRGFRKGLRARENPYLKSCPPAVQAALTSLYAEMPRDSVNKSAVERLVRQVIPMAGFSGGCVFVVDPTAMCLVPRTMIGKVKMRRLSRVPLKGGNVTNSPLFTDTVTMGGQVSSDLAGASFACDQPLIERSELDGPDATAGIYSSLGKNRKIGVLYLEVPESDLANTDPQALHIFKAVRHALCDALLVD